MVFRVLLALALLLAAAAPAVAQIAEGARVRARVPPSLVLVGTVQSVSADSLQLRHADGRQFSLARQNLELERSIGRTRNFWKHFGLTVGGAALAGGLISAFTWEECTEAGFGCLFEPETRMNAFALGFVGGGVVVGVPVGLVVGSVVKVERWERVPPGPPGPGS